MTELKPREKKVLEYIRSITEEQGFPPTVRQICQACGIKSTSTVHKDLESLSQKGYITKGKSKTRALVLNDKEKAPERARTDIVDVPVVGRIAAGMPILAEQNVEDYFPLPSRYCGKGINYMLNVKGESMIEAGIMDGDFILVEEAEDARDGEIVVAMIDGFESEATVKTFYREGDHIKLQPENSAMSPIIVSDVKILGKVKGVFRYFN